MKYDLDRSESEVTVALSGHLTYNCFPIFTGMLHELDGAVGTSVVFDLSDLSRLDSAGLGLLYVARQELGERGMIVSLASPHDDVRRLLDLTAADQCFEIRN